MSVNMTKLEDAMSFFHKEYGIDKFLMLVDKLKTNKEVREFSEMFHGLNPDTIADALQKEYASYIQNKGE